jgi:hypothetical protein
MSTDQLQLDLTEIADEVVVVNLHDRVLRESRKIGIRRTVIASVAAVAVVAAASVTAFAAMPRDHRTPVAPAASPHVTASAAPTVTKSPANVDLDGTTYYITNDNAKVALHAMTGTAERTVLTLPAGAGQCPYYTLSVSPTAKRIAYITDAGLLYVADLDGSGRKLVTGGVQTCLGGAQIHWRDDAYFTGPLAVSSNNVLAINAATATVVSHAIPMSRQGPISPNGQYVAAMTQSGQHYVATLGGAGRHNYTYKLPAGSGSSWSARSVSNDGRYVAVGIDPTDSGRGTLATAIVDVRTGKVVKLPITGPILHIQFLADGNVLANTGSENVLLTRSLMLIDDAQANYLTDAVWLSFVS